VTSNYNSSKASMSQVVTKQICNVCGCDQFVAQKRRPNVKCVVCRSLERTRLMWLYLERIVRPHHKILHLAPEQGIYNRLTHIVKKENYVTSDLFPENFPFAEQMQTIDLCNLESQPSSHYDLIIHSHVMEHTYCSYAYTLYHLHRMLSATGKHVCVIPFIPGQYSESLEKLSGKEKTIRFGQNDHCRKYGADDVQSHVGKVLRLPIVYDITKDFSPSRLDLCNIPEEAWRGYSINSVLVLNKHDYLLGSFMHE
jgi:hypothetical protein